MHMYTEICDFDEANEANIAVVVAFMDDENESFVVLSDYDLGDQWYVQAAGSTDAGFIVERRDGHAGEHFRADRRLKPDELVALLTSFLRRAPDWKSALTWDRVCVSQGRPQA